MLTIEHLCCGYGNTPVLADVSFSVESGQCLCVMGPNGCGKTTLLRAIAGLLPYQGHISMFGKDLQSLSRREIARNMALLSQISSVYFSYTVYETVLMGRYAHSTGAFSGTSETDRRIALDAMARTGTLDLKDRLITELSGGQLQRVFLARTFAQSPRIILLDEPTNHLDLKYQVQLVADLKNWAAQEERCVVGVLHDVNLALDFADVLVLLADGHLQAFCPADRFDPALLSQVYQMDVPGYMHRTLERWKEKQ